MSITSEITRLTNLRNNIRTKLIALGVITNTNATLSDCYTGINGIPAKSSSDLTVSTATVNVPAGYYKENASKAVTTTTKGATNYSTSTSNQTIAAGTYLTGVQTIFAVKTAGLSAANVKKGVVVKVGDAMSEGRLVNFTGTYEGGSNDAKTLLITSSTNWTVPSGVSKVQVICIGGGGSGGGNAAILPSGASSSNAVQGGCGAGGGGGYVASGTYSVTAGQSIAITIGAGGTDTASSSASAVGGTGGTTSFGSLCSAAGGAGGGHAIAHRSTATLVKPNGGAGGSGGGGGASVANTGGTTTTLAGDGGAAATFGGGGGFVPINPTSAIAGAGGKGGTYGGGGGGYTGGAKGTYGGNGGAYSTSATGTVRYGGAGTTNTGATPSPFGFDLVVGDASETAPLSASSGPGCGGSGYACKGGSTVGGTNAGGGGGGGYGAQGGLVTLLGNSGGGGGYLGGNGGGTPSSQTSAGGGGGGGGLFSFVTAGKGGNTSGYTPSTGAGIGYGAGGSGAGAAYRKGSAGATTVLGGAGASGCVVIRYFI